MGNLTFDVSLNDGGAALSDSPKRGFWDAVGHLLFHKKTKHSGGMNDNIAEPYDYSALSDCGCIDPEALADGKGKGVKMPKAEDIARAKKLNHRFAKFRSQLGVTYRAFCGGKNGFMVKRYVESCLADGTPSVNTTDMKPIGIGPASLANFEKWHGISFEHFEAYDEDRVAEALKAHNKSKTKPAAAKTGKSPKPKAQSPKPKAQSPKPKAQSPKPKAAAVVEQAAEVIAEKAEVIAEAKEKIAEVRKQRDEKEISPSKAEAVIEKQREIIAEAKEEIAEAKAEVVEVKQEVKASGGNDKMAMLMAAMGKFNNAVEAL